MMSCDNLTNTQLREELNHSMSDSTQKDEQILALKQAVHEQEAELRAIQEKMETQKMMFEMELQEKLAKMEEKVEKRHMCHRIGHLT